MLDELERVLSQLYTTSEAARLISDHAGIPQTFIDFDGPIGDVWHRIVEQADRRQKVPDLLRKATTDYPNRVDLQRMFGAFLYGRDPKNTEQNITIMGPRSDTSSDALGRLERSVNRLNEIINGTDWGAEGLQAATRRIEAKMEMLAEEVARVAERQKQNRTMAFASLVLWAILTLTFVVAYIGILRGMA